MRKEYLKDFPVKDLKPYEKNPRINGKAVEGVVKSIKRNGNIDPVEVDENNVILTGHTRLKAFKKLKIEVADVIRVSGLAEEQKKSYRVEHNKTNETAEWDFDVLGEEFDFDELEDFGFEIGDRGDDVDFDESDDEVPEVKESFVKKGDVWLLGRHRIECGDSTVVADVEDLMGGEKVDSLQTDPPYGVDYSGKNEFLNNLDEGNRIQKDIQNDAIENYREFFASFLSIIPFADYNTIYCWMSNLELHNLRLAFDDCQIKWGDYLVWKKNNHVLGRKDYNSKHEFCVYGWKGKHKFYGDFSTTILEYDKPVKSELHPTMKPVEMIAKLIVDGSPKNGLVYDAFLGSGSTLIACEKTGRKCYGMEIDEHYCQVVIERYINFVQNKGSDVFLLKNGEQINYNEVKSA